MKVRLPGADSAATVGVRFASLRRVRLRIARVRDAGLHAWRVVRTLAGEDAYEHYLAHLQAMHPDGEPMTAAAFYRQREVQKWDGIKRCC